MKVTRIEFEDRGQDFLTWDIEENGIVIDCKPFQARFWCGGVVANKKLNVGDQVIFIRDLSAFLDDTEDENASMIIKYPIIKVEHIDVHSQDENQLNYWGDLFKKQNLRDKLNMRFDVFINLSLPEKQALIKQLKKRG